MIAAPRLQPKHKYINRDVAQWLDIHFGDHSFNGRVFVGHRKSGGGVYTMTARSLSELRQYVMLVHASQRLDYYITANSVSGTSRNIDGLFGLQNIVIDVDCHDEAIVNTAELVQAFLWRCSRDLWDAEGLPSPNSIVRTGRGVQLWWAIKPCHVSCRPYYDQIKTGLMDHIDAMLAEYPELEGLEMDRGASNNPVGYFRLPCTYNTRANRYGTLQILHSERYDTHDLAKYIKPFAIPRLVRTPSKKAQSVSMQKSDIIVLHNAYSTGASRVMQLIKLRNLRDSQIGEETRNNLCFAVYNALRMSFDHDEAMERLYAYNEGFKKPMSDRELDHTVCSAAKKGGYKYSNAKLIELLGITPEEQDAIGLHPFTGKYKPWSYAKPNATRDAVRKAKKDGRNLKIIEMHQAGESQAETARQLGISRNTVARVLQEWRDEIAQRDLEIAQDDLLNFGSIYDDCLLCASEGVSSPGGQSETSVTGGLFVLPRNGPSGDG